jgi:hypothetical protein
VVVRLLFGQLEDLLHPCPQPPESRGVLAGPVGLRRAETGRCLSPDREPHHHPGQCREHTQPQDGLTEDCCGGGPDTGADQQAGQKGTRSAHFVILARKDLYGDHGVPSSRLGVNKVINHKTAQDPDSLAYSG